MRIFIFLICFCPCCLIAVLNAKKATVQKKKNTPRKTTSNMPSSSGPTPTNSTAKDDSHATEAEEAPLANGNVDSHNSSQYVSGDTLQQKKKEKKKLYHIFLPLDRSGLEVLMFPFWAFDTIIDLSKSTTTQRSRTMMTRTLCTRMKKKTWRTTGGAATTTSQSEMCFTKVAMSLSVNLGGAISQLFGWQETLCK